jgi:hypothetical protein
VVTVCFSCHMWRLSVLPIHYLSVSCDSRNKQQLLVSTSLTGTVLDCVLCDAELCLCGFQFCTPFFCCILGSPPQITLPSFLHNAVPYLHPVFARRTIGQCTGTFRAVNFLSPQQMCLSLHTLLIVVIIVFFFVVLLLLVLPYSSSSSSILLLLLFLVWY